MRLVSATIENYRSITTARKIPIHDRTVLVGPNNEGKSNLVSALSIAMRTLTDASLNLHAMQQRKHMLRMFTRRYFDWHRDFPLNLQEKNLEGRAEITLEFELEPNEILEFRKEVKSSLNGTLPSKVSFGREVAEIRVAKKGPGGHALTNKSPIIAAFVSARVDFEHIPAVRTASSAGEVVDALLGREIEVT